MLNKPIGIRLSIELLLILLRCGTAKLFLGKVPIFLALGKLLSINACTFRYSTRVYTSKV